MPSQLDLSIEQGETFVQVVRWETEPLQYAAISAIEKSAPAVITAAAHGVPDGWRVAVVSAKGMTEINAAHFPPRTKEWHRAYVTDVDTVELRDVNAAEFSTYKSGGYLMFYAPVDLTDYTARMQIKSKVGGEVLASLTSPDDIAVDAEAKTITVTIAADVTAAFDWKKGVYDLELVSAGGVVTAVLAGRVLVSQEVTTEA